MRLGPTADPRFVYPSNWNTGLSHRRQVSDRHVERCAIRAQLGPRSPADSAVRLSPSFVPPGVAPFISVGRHQRRVGLGERVNSLRQSGHYRKPNLEGGGRALGRFACFVRGEGFQGVSMILFVNTRVFDGSGAAPFAADVLRSRAIALQAVSRAGGATSISRQCLGRGWRRGDAHARLDRGACAFELAELRGAFRPGHEFARGGSAPQHRRAMRGFFSFAIACVYQRLFAAGHRISWEKTLEVSLQAQIDSGGILQGPRFSCLHRWSASRPVKAPFVRGRKCRRSWCKGHTPTPILAPSSRRLRGQRSEGGQVPAFRLAKAR